MGSFFYLALIFLCFMASFAISVKDTTTDQSALLAFKAQVTDSLSVLAANWSIPYPVCNWIGVSCGARHGRVTALRLSDMGLRGTIPPQLGNLSFLIHLNISRNNFHGHLPSELGHLQRLRFVGLAFNELSGSLPSWVGVLSELRVLDLGNNSFGGTIPSSLFNLSMLEELNFGYNLIGGNIPSRIGNLSQLRHLNLAQNNLKGEIPTEIGNLENLYSLVLPRTNLSGSIPPTIFNISTLTLLNLATNHLSGNLPSSIGSSLRNIQFITLRENELSGSIPNSITNASTLILLELLSNSFSGQIPDTFGNLRNLRSLNVGNNNLTLDSSSNGWGFLSSLTNCISLRTLSVSSNPLGGNLPSLIGNFSASLQNLYAANCKLKGFIPQEIGNLSGLIILSLYSNEFSGTIPVVIARLNKLQGLALDGNNLQGSIPDDLCLLKDLTGLLLYGNKLSGRIPSCLASLTSLRTLRLNSNNLSFSIPSSFWSLGNILQVNLSSNHLTGSLPSDIQNLKVLIFLDLSWNQLSGVIPTTIGGLRDLISLSLAGNRLQGPIPESFASLASLEALDLSNNNLSGEIPKSMEKLGYLQQLDLSHNRLEGEIPINGSFRNFAAESFLSNYALCGPPRLQVPPCKEYKHKRSKKNSLFVLKYILPPTILIVVGTIVIFFCRRRRNMRTKNMAQEDQLPLQSWRRTSYLELQKATDGFNDSRMLGAGSFGSVYKGIFSNGTIAAIKVFNLQQKAFTSFESECEVLRNVRHRNLIKILSSCSQPDFKALVLEFMPNGSLENWLYSHNNFLDIMQRLSIMIDVGLAIEYLHHCHSSVPVIHCDLKPSNILLDEDMVAHVSDFGISKLLGEGDDSMAQTMTMATVGYMAPEYGSEGIISTRCDVYSFGIVLMETFTRKKPTDEFFSEEMSLKNWVKDSLPQRSTEVVDANLVQEDETFSAKMECVLSILHLALDCCMNSPDQRINMKDATVQLKKMKMQFLADTS